MIIMTGLIIAIKDIGYLALSSTATPICVLHIRICHKVLLLPFGTHILYRSLTPGHFWFLIIPECLLMQVSVSKCMFSISKVTIDSLNRVTNDAI